MKNKNKGFTLAELLIVVAIIGVLVAISIPIFTSQLEKAREATDAANIRSQYAEVMSEAITEGGKDQFGAVELKQKKDQWQSSGLKENLEGVYGQVVGEYPKAGGTAWVEYKDDQAILHYEGGSGSSGSGSGNTGGGSTGGGSTGGNTGGSTGGGSNSGGSGSGSGGGSDSGGNSGEGTVSQVDDQAEKWPDVVSKDYSIKRGNVYSYKGVDYVALTDHDVSSQYPEYPNSSTWYLRQVNTEAKVLNSSDRVRKNDGTYDLRDLKLGQLYVKDDGTVWIRVYGEGYGVEPPDGANWQILNGVSIK